jgi:hypothetical protein
VNIIPTVRNHVEVLFLSMYLSLVW